jgi:hypothetical protein
MTQPPSLRTTGTESSTVVRNMVTIGLETRHTALMGENHPKSMQFELLWDMESFKVFSHNFEFFQFPRVLI